ncbi:hypothetical protein PVAG01_02649 [Phlyctema vagabunda]|uniref:Uncharacterized protein n=1 Tax=Phlyctema vagabunda TaxID=108571 RepID=A0ABR4PRQ2_9HELO
MSLKGSPIGWWKEKSEKRHRSYSGIATGPRPLSARPATALTVPKTRAAQEKEDNERHLQKLIEEAVLIAFSSDAFRDAVASQLNPATTRQQEQLDHLNTTNSTLQSSLQTCMDEFPATLKPIEDHLTGLHIPTYGKEMNGLAAGQEKILRSLNSIEERIKSLEEKTESLDSSVVNTDLRSAIRFGEVSNELQDQNTVVTDRIWELERSLGKTLEVQQRRVVRSCEELGRAIRTTQDRITSFEEASATGFENLALETANVSSLVDSTQKQLSMDDIRRSKTLSDLDSDVTYLKDGIQGLQKQLDLLDTTPLKSHTHSLEGLTSNLSRLELHAKSIDTKLLTSHTQSLETLTSSLSRLEEHVGALDTTPLASHTETLQSLTSSLSRLEEHVNLLDTAPLESHTEKLGNMESLLTQFERHLSTINTAPLASHTEQLDNIATLLSKVENHISTLDTTPLASHTEQLDSLSTNMSQLEQLLNALDTTPLASHTSKLEDLKTNIMGVESLVNERLLSHLDSLQQIRHEISQPPDYSDLEKMLADLQYAEQTSTDELQTISAAIESILDTTSSNKSEFTVQSKNITTVQGSLDEFRRESAASLTNIMNSVNMDHETFESRFNHLNANMDAQAAVIADFRGADLISLLKEVQELNLGHSEALDALKHDFVDTYTSIEEMHGETVSHMKHNTSTLSNELEKITGQGSSQGTEVRALQTKLQTITETLEGQSVTLQVISTFEPIAELSQKVFESHDLLTKCQTALGQNADISIEILSRSTDLDLKTEKITEYIYKLDETVKDEFKLNSNATEAKRSAFEEEISETLSAISTQVINASGIMNSALGKLDENLSALNGKVTDDMASIAAQSEAHKTAIEGVRCLVDDQTAAADILHELRSSKAILEKAVTVSEVLEGLQLIKEEFTTSSKITMREIAHTKRIIQEVQHNQCGEEILTTINDISKEQLLQTHTMLQSLRSIEENTTLPNVLSSLDTMILSIQDLRTSCEKRILPCVDIIQTTTSNATISIESMLQDFQQFGDVFSKILDDVGNVKQVVHKNEYSTATIHERTVELDTKIKMSQDAVQDAIQEMQTAINRDIIDTTRSITDSVNDAAAGLEINIKNIDSRIATSTKAVRAELKAIDLSPLEPLRADVGSITKMTSETTKQISTITDEISESKSHIVSTNEKAAETLSEALKSHITSAAGKETGELLAAIGSLDVLLKEHNKKTQDSLKAISTSASATTDGLKVIVDERLPKLAVSLGKLDPSLAQTIESIDSISNAIKKLEQTTKASETVLSAEVQSSIIAVKNIGTTGDRTRLEILQAIQTNGGTLSSIQETTQRTSSQVTTLAVKVPSIQQAITEAESKNTTTLEAISSKIPSLLHAIQDNQVSIQANGEALSGLATTSSMKSISAAICRIDKTVLETGAQIKGVVYEGNKKVIKEMDSVLSQLDESINQNEIRIQGISEFEIPRLEWQLTKNYDALHIIGARVIGTSKRFEEAVREHSNGHHPGKGSHQLVGRLRSSSNTRSAASSGKDSGGTRS